MRTRLVCLALAASLWTAWTATTVAFHFELLRSTPAAKAALAASPVRLQLWFSQVPAAGVSQLMLKNDKGDVALGKTMIVTKDKSMYADPVGALAAGRYTIHWRGAGDDGHVQQGDIAFTVSAK
jgi:methionine-rich copper-binding protein CopC